MRAKTYLVSTQKGPGRLQPGHGSNRPLLTLFITPLLVFTSVVPLILILEYINLWLQTNSSIHELQLSFKSINLQVCIKWL